MQPIASVAVLLLLSAWAGAGRQETAKAVLRDAEGRTLGEVLLEQTPGGVLLRGELQGLPPGVHGFHFHERGRCEPTFEAAGEHYNPAGREHGFRNPAGPHAGDLPNIIVMSDGKAAFEALDTRVTLSGGRAPLLDPDGTTLIVHAGPDDYRTNPAGGSGARIACGVVTAMP